MSRLHGMGRPWGYWDVDAGLRQHEAVFVVFCSRKAPDKIAVEG
jgi:hypothetical protein